MDLRLLLLIFGCLIVLTSSTHFAYGTYQWDLTKNQTNAAGTQVTQKQYRFQIELAFRRSFAWPTPPPGSSKPPNEGDTVNVGSVLWFYPMGNYANGPLYNFAIALLDKVNYINDDWFTGTQTITLQLETYLDRNWRHFYSECCRLSSIRDRNNDTPWTLTGVINRFGKFSPRVTGLPRIWFSLLVPNLYTIPVIHPLGRAVTYRYATKPESSLNEPCPVDPVSANHVVTTTNLASGPFILNSLTGDCVWTPQKTGLYALGFIIVEKCSGTEGVEECGDSSPNKAGSKDGNNGATADNCCTRVPFDFIFAVVPECNITIAAQTGCAVPPYFYRPFAPTVPPEWRQWNFTRGIQGTFQVCARNDDKSQTQIDIDHSIFPGQSVWVVAYISNPSCYYYSWTPGLTDVDQIVCFFATSRPNMEKSRGQYCIKLHILPGNCIQLSGIIRDFHYFHDNMNRSYSDGLEHGVPNWVSPTLSNIWKPVFQAGSPAPTNVKGTGLQTSTTNPEPNYGSLWGFYDWYTTDDPTRTTQEPTNSERYPGQRFAAPRNRATSSQQLFCSGIVANNDQIFTFLQSAFFPIDNQLFGNEGDDHNYYFTYELNTYFQYIRGQTFNVQSDDDLWVFIDGRLPGTTAKPWNLYGIKTDDTSFTPPQAKGYLINIDDFVANTHALTLNETYRCDIFYANRMRRFPYLRIDTTNTTLCDALSVSDFQFNYQNFANANGQFYLTSSSSNPAKFATYAGAQAIQLTDRTTQSPDSYAAVWYGSPATLGEKVKASHGFVMEVSFVVNQAVKGKGPPGMAIVFAADKIPSGASGPNLGYAGNVNFAVELDMARDGSQNDVDLNQTEYSQIAYHLNTKPKQGFATAPPYGPNSATESGSDSGLFEGAAYNQDKTMFLNMQNGTVHTLRLEYQPGLSDFSDPANPVYAVGWMRAFMRTPNFRQLAPFTAYQLPGKAMNDLLGGSCYLGITAGLNAQTGLADIFITNWNFKFVPTNPSSTSYLLESRNIVAGNEWCVTVQAKDACNNLITVGGEADQFDAVYQPLFCNRLNKNVSMPAKDNNNGSYTFCYSPVIMGPYEIKIKFAGVPIDQGKQQLFQVIHAPADPASTIATFGELPDCFHSPRYCVGVNTQGIFASRFNNRGQLIKPSPTTPIDRWGFFFDMSGAAASAPYDGGLAAFQSYVTGVANTDILAIAIVGDITDTTTINNIKTAANSIRSPVTAMKNFASLDTYAFVGTLGTGVSALKSSSCGSTAFCEVRSANGTAEVWARGQDPVVINAKNRNFTVRAQSANSGCGPYSRVNSFYDDVRRPAGQNNHFALIARDRFGNLCDDAEASFQPPIWNPDFTQQGGNRPPGTLTPVPSNSVSGYYQWQFLSYRAGQYQVNFLLNGVNIKGSPYTVTITPGLANVTTSSGSGPAMTTAIAGGTLENGVWKKATFTLNLADKVNNSKNFNDTEDVINGTLYRYSNGVRVEAIPISLRWIDDPATGCQQCLLEASYNATVASTTTAPIVSYQLDFYMNGETRTYALPNIVPAALYPPLCIIDMSQLPLYNPAGTPLLFTIQAKDRFNNTRTVPNVAGNTFFVETDTVKSGTVTVAYAGSGGIYNAQFRPRIKGPLPISVQVLATGADPYLAQGTHIVGNRTINITPGPADPYWSYVEGIPEVDVIAGVFFNYSILSFDEFGNKRDNQPFTQFITAKVGDYVLRSYIPPAGDATVPPTVLVNAIAPFSNFETSGNFSVQTNATIAGLYTLKVQTGLDSNIADDVDGTLNRPPSQAKFQTPYTSVKVVPAPTWGPKTLYTGPGIYGGKRATTAWFELTAFDLYNNQIADYHDNSVTTVWPQNPFGEQLYTVEISGVCKNNDLPPKCPGQAAAPAADYTAMTLGTITNGAKPGTYNVTYIVPDNQKSDYSPFTDFNITIKHSGGRVYWPYSVGPWQVVIPAKALAAPNASCAKLNYTNGTAGTISNWRIDDLSCSDGGPIYTTPSFLVTLTRVADGATINPIKVVCVNADCGSVGSTNSKFNVSFLPTDPIGRFRIRVYAYGYMETLESSTGQGLLVDIFPGPVYPPACSVVGFPGTVLAGDPFMFSVALSDQWHHPITGPDYIVFANASGPTSQLVNLGNAGYNANPGNYTFTTSALTKAGSWGVQILESTSQGFTGGLPQIGGLLLNVLVKPGRVDASTTFAIFPEGTLVTTGLKTPFATAGEFGFFTVYPKDKYANDLPFPDEFTGPTTHDALSFDDNVAGPFMGPSGESTWRWDAAADPSNPLNLVYKVTYNATKIMSGGNIITVKANNVNLAGATNNDGDPIPVNPYNVLITPARISSDLSNVSPNGNQVIAAGSPMTFTLTAIDIWGNPWHSDKQQNLNALVSIPGVIIPGVNDLPGSPPPPGTTIQAAVEPSGGGVYVFTILDTKQASGFDTTAKTYKYDNTITLNYINGADSQELTGSGGLDVPTFAVEAGPTDPTQTTFNETPYPLMANTYRAYSVITVDRFGNRRWKGEQDIVNFLFYEGNVDCTDNMPPVDATTSKFIVKPGESLGFGAYKVNFTGKITGIYTINVTVQPVPPNPQVSAVSLDCPQVYKLIQQVIPGPAYPPNCWYTVSPCDNVPAGGKLDFFLQMNDEFGNAILRSGTRWAIGYYNMPGPYTDPSKGPAATDLTPQTGADKFDKTTLWVQTDTPPKGGVRSGWTMPTVSWLNPVKDNKYDGSQTLTPPEASITIKDFGNSSYAFSVQVYKGGYTGIVVSAVNDTGIWVVIPAPTCFVDSSNGRFPQPQSTVNVVPGAPRQFLPYPPPIFTVPGAPVTANSVTAAIPNSFSLQAKDYWGNDINTSTHYYEIELQDISNGNGYTMNVVPGTTVNGLTPVDVQSAWHGNFTLSITLYPNSTLPGADNSAVNPPSKIVEVQHATCAFANPDKPYRCPDRSCVAEYANCASKDPCSTDQVWCGGSSCLAKEQTCGSVFCAADGLTQCSDGHCAKTCPPVAKCGSGYIECSPSKLCRQSVDDCPSPVVCPSSYMLCPDGVGCARTKAECDQRYLSPCDAGKGYRCATGECALTLDECPTPVSCGKGMVLCGTDGSCRADRTDCPDQYKCYGNTSLRCSSGVCVSQWSQCPPSITCTAGFVKCEDERCAPTFAECKPALTCPYNQTRCPDGSCTNNLLFCATPRSCPTDKSVLCWDGSCVQYGSECTYPQACPGTSLSCPGGACAKYYDQCPTNTRCPDSSPVLCNDGSCKSANSMCPSNLPKCPIETAVRCPDGQSCRAQLSDCPSIVTCQDDKVKCSDGTCAIALDKCAPVAECPSPNVKCAGGECVSRYELCPTHVTCAFGYAKCTDGSCHEQCPTVYQQCPLGSVTCPQASAGTQCAPTLTACPVSFICPYPSTVRCTDSTCALTAQDCPKPPKDDDYITNKVPCADGTYAADQQSCPTPVTCPSQTPFKCYDSTCKMALADCPVPSPCPRSGIDDPPSYRCSNGACSAFPWDAICTSAATPCPSEKPFQCSTVSCKTDALQCCRATAAECDTLTNPALNCTKGFCEICPLNWFYCQSGSCVKNSQDCEAPTCPPSLPTKCTDGLCAEAEMYCNNKANGCPYDKPEKCSTGICAENFTMCSKLTNGVPTCATLYPDRTQTCPDGSCSSDQNFCPPSNGCPGGSDITRCYDGSCASVCNNPPPSTSADPVNACPSAFPFRCSDGFCSKSDAACPYPLFDAQCAKINGSKPFQCAVGTCVVSSVQCPPLYPCDTGEVRCGDGSCKKDWSSDPKLPTCPRADTCPTGSTRCTANSGDLGSGLCSSDPSLCSIDIVTGCPSTHTKCPTGQCVAAGGSCDTIPDASGCGAGLVKCYDGSCKTAQSLCSLPDGCPQTYSRCPYGECKQNPADCSGTAPTDGTVKCADGSYAKPELCPGLNGCPKETPFRCANGVCSAKTALAGGCVPTPACGSGQVICADGSCKTTFRNCPSVSPCPSGTTLCPNFKCAATCSNNTGSVYCPSSSSPILCPDGVCAYNLGQCKASAGGPINQNCPSPKVRCIDETCVKYTSECIIRALIARLTQNLNAACPNDGVMCADGSCRGSSRECGIIPRCPLGQFRCPNGTCADGKSSNGAVNPCNQNVDPPCLEGYDRCEDGTCRKVICRNGNMECRNLCLEYDGCGIKYPYHCANRECARTTAGCSTAALGNPVIKPNARRLLATTVADPCIPSKQPSGFCMSEVKASQTIITVDTTESSTVAIALDPNSIPRLSLTFSSGSFVLTDGSTVTGFKIRPVGESRMRNAVNEIHTSRRLQFGNFLPFSTTVLTAAFECEVMDHVDEPFNINVTVQAYFDRRANVVNESDICLARLVELPGFTTWRCLFPSGADRDFTGPYYVKKNPKLPAEQIESVFSRCTPQASDVTGIQATVNATAYAFIWSPIPKAPKKPEGPDVIQQNIVWIILGVLLGIAGLVLLTYCAFRLYRYRNKYKEQKEEADRLQEEVENMRQFGGEAGQKDDQVNMTANPLAVQLKDVQAKYNEEDMKLQQAEADLRKQEGEIRQEHIKNMRENRDQLASQLEKLKRQLAETQAANQPKATYEEDGGGASYTTDEPVREEFDGGSGQPGRKKREL